MNIQFLEAKNSEKIFTVDSVYFHSSYNPSREAEKFAESIVLTPGTKILIIIEPGFSYSYKSLKEKYPNIKIGAVRIIKEITSSDWDFVIDYENIYNSLIFNFSESELFNSVIISWPTAERIFSDKMNNIWSDYKKSLEYAKTILTTRQYFEKKWLINSVNFFKFTSNFSTINKISVPVVIAASGPSLKNAISVLKKHRNKFFLIALSSAISPLLHEKILPDLCFSTDGGYYANQHLKNLYKYDIPIAISPESYISKALLKKLHIVPLNYGDGLSSKLLEISKIKSHKAERNGTVSGTAFKFAESITTKKIYFCGLDLSFAKGFQHIQPNLIEINSIPADNFLNSKEKRIARSEMNKDSLNIYKDWFANLKNTEQFVRVIDNSLNKLGSIQDMNINNFEKELLEYKAADLQKVFTHYTVSSTENISDFIDKNFDQYKEQIFPIDFLAINHAEDEVSRKKAETKLKEKTEEILNKIRRICSNEA